MCWCPSGQRRTLKVTGTSAARFYRWELWRGSPLRSVQKNDRAPKHLFRGIVFSLTCGVSLVQVQSELAAALARKTRKARKFTFMSLLLLLQNSMFSKKRSNLVLVVAGFSVRAGLWDSGHKPPGASHAQWGEQPGNTLTFHSTAYTDYCFGLTPQRESSGICLLSGR